MKYLKLFEDQTGKKKSAMQRLLDSGTDPEIVASYKSKYSEKEKEKIRKKNKEFFDKVEKSTKENDEIDGIDTE
jgi:hypothetical protein